MPIQEIVTTLKTGEAVTIMGPGTLEFQAPKVAAVAAKTVGGAKGTAVAAAGAAGAAGSAAGQTAALSTGATLKAIPASLMSGKILGLSLGALNPWLLIGAGAVGGYYYCKKNRFNFF
jgi:hypothetical protein